MSSLELHLNDGTLVKNVAGTGDQKAPGHNMTWKQHYLRDGARQWPFDCRISHCTEPADGAGHINVKGKRDVYIIPMCDRRHNTAQNADWLPVKEGTVALRVNGNEDENGWCVIL